MNTAALLVIGSTESQLQNMISKFPHWNCTIAKGAEEAIEKFHQQLFDVVIITTGITNEEERKIRTIFTFQDNDLEIINATSCDHDAIEQQIKIILADKSNMHKPALHFVDDALRSAAIPISYQ